MLDYIDSEDLMTWLLQNSEDSEVFDEHTHNNPSAVVHGSALSNALNSSITHDWIQSPLMNMTQTDSKTGNFANDTLNNALKKARGSAKLKSQKANGSKSSDAKINSSSCSSTNNSDTDKNNSKGILSSLLKGNKKRQRETLEDMESRVKSLKEENDDLQAHVMTILQKSTKMMEKRMAMEASMKSQVNGMKESKECDHHALSKTLNKYINIYSDYGTCRQKESNFHLEQLEKLILPTKTTKMILWILQQPESFYNKSKSPLYSMLADELGLLQEQTSKVQERRDNMKGIFEQITKTLELLRNLQHVVDKKRMCYEKLLRKLQDIASPSQIITFLMWLSEKKDTLKKMSKVSMRKKKKLSTENSLDQEVCPVNSDSTSSSANETKTSILPSFSPKIIEKESKLRQDNSNAKSNTNKVSVKKNTEKILGTSPQRKNVASAVGKVLQDYCSGVENVMISTNKNNFEEKEGEIKMKIQASLVEQNNKDMDKLTEEKLQEDLRPDNTNEKTIFTLKRCVSA